MATPTQRTRYPYKIASSIKFSHLISRPSQEANAFQPDDVFIHDTGVRLCIEYDADGSPVEHREAAGREGWGLLNPDGTPLTAGNGDRLFATGPEQLHRVVRTIRGEYPCTNSYWWQHWHVVRNGQDLGTMAEVRQRYHDAHVANAADEDGARDGQEDGVAAAE